MSNEKPTSGNVARNIARAREAAGLTYAEFSRRTHALEHPLPVLALQRIERGQRRIDVDDLTTCSAVLGVPVLELLAPAVDDPYENASGEAYQLTGTSDLTPTEARGWLIGELTDFDDDARVYWGEQRIKMLQDNLDGIAGEISRIQDPRDYELRATALALEQAIDYEGRHVERLRKRIAGQ